MQFFDRLRSFLAGLLSRLANKISKPDTQLAITYKEEIEEHTHDIESNDAIQDKDPLKVVSCTVKSVRVKKHKKIEN